MSFPFGGHPKLSDMLDWLADNGCTIKRSAKTARSGRPYDVILVESAKGEGFVTIPNPDPDERLPPSIVSNFQRRLGIKIPYAAMPEQTKND